MAFTIVIANTIGEVVVVRWRSEGLCLLGFGGFELVDVGEHLGAEVAAGHAEFPAPVGVRGLAEGPGPGVGDGLAEVGDVVDFEFGNDPTLEAGDVLLDFVSEVLGGEAEAGQVVHGAGEFGAVGLEVL